MAVIHDTPLADAPAPVRAPANIALRSRVTGQLFSWSEFLSTHPDYESVDVSKPSALDPTKNAIIDQRPIGKSSYELERDEALAAHAARAADAAPGAASEDKPKRTRARAAPEAAPVTQESPAPELTHEYNAADLDKLLDNLDSLDDEGALSAGLNAGEGESVAASSQFSGA